MAVYLLALIGGFLGVGAYRLLSKKRREAQDKKDEE